jgi:hypothetical protein
MWLASPLPFTVLAVIFSHIVKSVNNKYFPLKKVGQINDWLIDLSPYE